MLLMRRVSQMLQTGNKFCLLMDNDIDARRIILLAWKVEDHFSLAKQPHNSSQTHGDALYSCTASSAFDVSIILQFPIS